MKQADSLREETIKAQVMGLPCTHRLKRSALVRKGTKSATNSWYGNNKHVMFLKLLPELKKKSKVANFFTMLKRRNREYNLYDCFHQKEQLSAL